MKLCIQDGAVMIVCECDNMLVDSYQPRMATRHEILIFKQ